MHSLKLLLYPFLKNLLSKPTGSFNLKLFFFFNPLLIEFANVEHNDVEGLLHIILQLYIFSPYLSFQSTHLLMSLECMFLGSLSRHNKDLEQRTLKPLAHHSSRILDKPCYSS